MNTKINPNAADKATGLTVNSLRCYIANGILSAVTEVVHSLATGWNVHFHVLLLLDRELDQLAMGGLKASLAARFARGVARCGGHASVDRQDLRPIAEGTEERLANYFFKGTTMRPSADGSRTPMAILSDLESTGEGFDLWDELTTSCSRNSSTGQRSRGHNASMRDSRGSNPAPIDVTCVVRPKSPVAQLQSTSHQL